MPNLRSSKVSQAAFVRGVLVRGALRTMLLITGFLATTAFASEADSIIPPKVVVETAANKITQRLIEEQEQVASQEYYVEHLVDEVLLPVVDHVYMARRVLAKHWRKASEEQKIQFIGAFKHKVIRTYAGAFKAFNGEKIIFEEARLSRTGKKASVESAIQRVGAPSINATYMLYLKNNEWLAYDVVIEGVSLVKSFRDQFSLSIEKHGLAKAISLLAAEYNSNSPTLKVGGNAWAPYISNQLPANGLVVNLVTTALSRAGYQVEMSFMPWQRISEKLTDGDLDISVASWHNETRAKELQFTDAYLENQLVIVKRKTDKLMFNSPQQFKQNITQRGYRLGVFKEYGYGSFFAEVAPLVSLDYYKYDKQMLREVANKNTDLALIDYWTAEQSLQDQKNIAKHLELIPTPVITQSLHATISLKRSDHKEIAEAFNTALKNMKEDGSYQEILDRYNHIKLAH